MIDSSTPDVLSGLLVTLRLSATVFRHDDYCGPWALNTSGSKRVTLHIVGRGSGWLHLRHRAPMPVRAGDIIVFPHDAWHVLTAEPKLPKKVSNLSTAGRGPSTTVLCGFFDFTVSGRNPILSALPEMILLRGEEVAGFTALESLVRLILSEAERPEPGRHAVVDRLCEVLFVMILRHHIARAQDRRGLLAALAEPRLAKALAAAHRDPGKRWRLETLAEVAGMSRTAFATTFRTLAGTSPMQYLAEWRMQRAAELLRERRESVAAIAERLGYDTEAAFRRAFRRIIGIPPGRVRRPSTQSSNGVTH